jgi:EAL domain-containing protein (putative c-di-GMP-specific phosphodiesterase class I)
MVEAISQVGRALGIATIAEKVESAAVFNELKRLGVQFAQGYYIAKPAPIDTIGSIPIQFSRSDAYRDGGVAAA